MVVKQNPTELRKLLPPFYPYKTPSARNTTQISNRDITRPQPWLDESARVDNKFFPFALLLQQEDDVGSRNVPLVSWSGTGIRTRESSWETRGTQSLQAKESEHYIYYTFTSNFTKFTFFTMPSAVDVSYLEFSSL